MNCDSADRAALAERPRPTNAYLELLFSRPFAPPAMFDNCPLSNEAAPSDQGARNAAAENPGTQPADAHVPVECACTGLHGAQSPDDLVAEYLTACRSDNTRRAYEIDLRDFAAWGGRIPSSGEVVAKYLAQRAQTLKPPTLRRRLAGLAAAHRDRSLADPTKATLVRRVMQGIERKHGAPPTQAAPLLIEDLARIVASLGNEPKDVRDRAILLVGFFAALRRSEIVALDVKDCKETVSGMLVAVQRSKTDQSGQGRIVHLAQQKDALCPVNAVRAWLSLIGSREGPLFSRSSFTDESPPRRISAMTVARIVKEHVGRVGLDPRLFSGHSLRAGFATSAALAGFDALLIARQTGHRSNRALSAYVRPNGPSLTLTKSAEPEEYSQHATSIVR